MSSQNKNPFMQDYLAVVAQDFAGYTREDAALVLSVLSVDELSVIARTLRARAVDAEVLQDCDYPVPAAEYGPAVLREAIWTYVARLRRSPDSMGRPAAPAVRESQEIQSVVHVAAVLVDRAARRDEARAAGVLTPPDSGRPYMK